MSSVIDEHQQWFDETTGELLVNGNVYVGTAGLDPVLNPKTIYSDRELTTVISSTQVTDSNGQTANKIWLSGKYSISVTNSALVVKYSELQNGFDEAVGNIQTTNSLGVNDITATGSPTQVAYRNNVTYIVTAPADVTGAMTINIDSIGVIPIKKAHDQAIASGDLKADTRLVMVYNDTDLWMELQSSVLNSVFTGDINVGGDVIRDGRYSDTMTEYSTLASTEVTVTEAIHDTITIVVPANWNTYNVETNVSTRVIETNTVLGTPTISVRVKETDLVGAQVGIGRATISGTIPSTDGNASFFGYTKGNTATGSQDWVLTASTTTDNIDMSIEDTMWNVTLKRVS
jgi:hypothetical protein